MLVVGRDPEIAAPKPTDWLALALNVVALKHVASELRKMIAVSITGRLDDEERTYVPESEWPKVVRESRCRLRTGARWPPTWRSCRRWSGKRVTRPITSCGPFRMPHMRDRHRIANQGDMQHDAMDRHRCARRRRR